MYSREQIIEEAAKLGYTHILTDGGPTEIKYWEPYGPDTEGFKIFGDGHCHIIENAIDRSLGSWLLITDPETLYRVNRSKAVSLQVKPASVKAATVTAKTKSSTSAKTYKSKSQSIISRTAISLAVLLLVTTPFFLSPKLVQVCSTYIAKAGTLVFVK
jgi:hypothetical protein